MGDRDNARSQAKAEAKTEVVRNPLGAWYLNTARQAVTVPLENEAGQVVDSIQFNPHARIKLPDNLRVAADYVNPKLTEIEEV